MTVPVVRKRRFNPIRVVNPSGIGHLVPLNPNQDFVLLLSAAMDLQDIDYTSNFFDLKDTQDMRDGTHLFTFSQTYDLTQWASLGSIYLGEVIIIGKATASSLCVMLASDKSDVLTVVNPKGFEIKSQPHQIIEVVVYDNDHPSKWKCSITPGDDGVEYKQCGYQSILSNTDVHSLVERMKSQNEFVVFPRAFDEFNDREHHYWFELTQPSMKTVVGWKTDTYYGGRIVFEPTCVTDETPDPSVMHIYLNVRGRNRKKLNAQRRVPDGFENDRIGADDCVLLPLVGGAFDDVSTRRSSYVPTTPTYSPPSRKPYRQTQAPVQSVVVARARPFATEIILKERVFADTMDPLYFGATALDQSAVNMSLSAKSNYKWGTHDYCC